MTAAVAALAMAASAWAQPRLPSQEGLTERHVLLKFDGAATATASSIPAATAPAKTAGNSGLASDQPVSSPPSAPAAVRPPAQQQDQ